MLALLAAAVAALASVATADAATVGAPITRSGTSVGHAQAYVGVANGFAILDPIITSFTPPVAGERYTAWVQLRAGCGSSAFTRNSTPRTATFGATVRFRVNGLLHECASPGSSEEVYLLVRRVSTGTIVGRARLFSAG